MAQINPADAAFAADRTAVAPSARAGDGGARTGGFAAFLGQVEASNASDKNAFDVTHATESVRSAIDEEPQVRDPNHLDGLPDSPDVDPPDVPTPASKGVGEMPPPMGGDPALSSIAALPTPTDARAIHAPLAAHPVPGNAPDAGTPRESITPLIIRDEAPLRATHGGDPTIQGDPLSASPSTDPERANPMKETAPPRGPALPFNDSAGAGARAIDADPAGSQDSSTRDDRPGARASGGTGSTVQTESGRVATSDQPTDQPVGRETQSRDGQGGRPGSPQITLQPSSEALVPAVARALEIESAVFAANANRSSDEREPALTASVLQPVETSTAHDVQSGRANREETSPVMHRVIRGMHAMINHRGGVLTMRLQPPELGDLRIRMIVHGQRVTAQFDAETVQAQNLLKNNLGMLQRALEQQGMVVERLTVHVSHSGHTGEPTERHDEADRHERPDAGEGESRGRRDEREHHREEAGRDSRFGFHHAPPQRSHET